MSRLQFGARNGGCSKVVAMELQPKVQKLYHHNDTGKLRTRSASRNLLLRPFFSPEAALSLPATICPGPRLLPSSSAVPVSDLRLFHSLPSSGTRAMVMVRIVQWNSKDLWHNLRSLLFPSSRILLGTVVAIFVFKHVLKRVGRVMFLF
jgi:hypothetical protein